MAAIDSKPSNRRWDSHPRVARKAKPKVALDDTEARLVLPEKQYRELLFRDFVKFCRERRLAGDDPCVAVIYDHVEKLAAGYTIRRGPFEPRRWPLHEAWKGREPPEWGEK